MQKLFLGLIIVCLGIALLVPVLSASAREQHWYCKRNAEHKQPTLDGEFSYIEQYGGIYVDKNHGDSCDDKVIYLTFDVGYENGNVKRIIDVLKDEGVKGSFFILGNVIDKEPELVKRMADDGHLVCNHTLTHQNLTGKEESVLVNEIKALENAYKNLTGKEMSKYFRPPEGTFDKEMLQRVNALGYKTVFWSFAYADWDNDKQMSSDKAMQKILDNIHNGEIMLLHPTSQTNADIMQSLIRELKAQGYRFATLDEM